MGIWLMPFAMFGMGTLVMFLALTLFGEYRKAFMANPMAVMTLDVFLAAMHRGGPAVARDSGVVRGRDARRIGRDSACGSPPV